MIKKIAVLFLISALAFCFASCGKNGETSKETETGISEEKVDFTDKSYQEVLDWAIENNKQDKVTIEFEKNDSVEEGTVISQSAVLPVKIETEGVTVKVSTGKKTLSSSGIKISVPEVKGLSEKDAEERIKYCGFVSEPVYVESSEVPEGAVIMTDPEKGVKLSPGSLVKIFVSKSRTHSVLVPDVIGKDFDTAKSELERSGLKVSTDIIYKDSDKDKDTVLLTSPLPGVTAVSGTEVTVTLSAGKKK